MHFLEIGKPTDMAIERDENDTVVQWMEFLDAKSKGVIEKTPVGVKETSTGCFFIKALTLISTE